MEKRIKNYFEKELSSKERLELLRQVETKEEWSNLYAKHKNADALLALSDELIDNAKSKKAFSRFKKKRTSKNNYTLLLKSMRYAALLLAVIFATHLISQRHFDKSLETITNKLDVPAGQHVNITLQDGTKVWLNAKSTLIFPAHFAQNERRITLEGEAYFDVAKDNKRPFVVSSKNVDMKVLGTQFNIYSYPQETYMEISLVEGKLEVYFKDKAYDSITLNKNQKVTIANSEMKICATNDEENLFLWKNGIYSFKNTLLIDILKKLELYYDLTIVVKDPSIFEWEYTGKFRQRDGIHEILRMISIMHKFKIDKDIENNTITLSSE